MTANLYWGMPVILYLFLAGVGAGASVVSASVLLRGHADQFEGRDFALARYGALLAPLPVILGCLFLVFKLGRPFRFVNLYTGIWPTSPMSVGTWLLTLYMLVSVVYAFTFLSPRASRDDRYNGLRTVLAWVMVPLGICVAVYTGVLLGAMPARPFWNTPILAFLFLLSSLSTGVATILLARTMFYREPDGNKKPGHQSGDYVLTASDLLLIGFELVVIVLFIMYAFLSAGDVKYAASVMLFGGDIATIFWLGVVIIGLAIPAVIEVYYIIPRLLYRRGFHVPLGFEYIIPVTVLVGGFLLRYVVVVAGQVTGPIGI